MVSKGFPNVVTLGQQYNIGEKPAVILYPYIDRHAGTPNTTITLFFIKHRAGRAGGSVGNLETF